MQRTTLDTILLRLPKLLKDRYGGNANFFWVAKYNDLLAELEATRCGPNNIVMVPVPWQMAQSNEVIKPHFISDITNLFSSISGELAWETAGQGAHILDTVPVESPVIDMNQLGARRSRAGRDIIHLSITGATTSGDAVIIHSGRGNSQPGEYNPEQLPAAAWVISYTPPTEYQGAPGFPIGVPLEDGEFDFPIVQATDFYWTFRDFLIVEGHRAYHRIAASSEITSLPPEWDDLVETYLRFRGEVQTDQFSKNASDWSGAWGVMKRRWSIAHSMKPSASKRKPPRPSLTLTSRR